MVGAPAFCASARLAYSAVQRDVKVLEVDAADDETDRRHHDVGDERGHDLAEGRADDHADGEIQDVAASRKLPEFLEHPAMVYLRGFGLVC